MARKYAAVWATIQDKGSATLHCPVADVLAITNAIKKEKAYDSKKAPDKVLDISIRELEPSEINPNTPTYTLAIKFVLKTDMSLRVLAKTGL